MKKTKKHKVVLREGRDQLSPHKIVILGIGNILLTDEGIGVHVANELAKMDLPSGLSVVEGGTDGFRLLNVITEADRLIVVDAVKGGAKPGSIYRFDISLRTDQCAAYITRPLSRHARLACTTCRAHYASLISPTPAA